MKRITSFCLIRTRIALGAIYIPFNLKISAGVQAKTQERGSNTDKKSAETDCFSVKLQFVTLRERRHMFVIYKLFFLPQKTDYISQRAGLKKGTEVTV